MNLRRIMYYLMGILFIIIALSQNANNLLCRFLGIDKAFYEDFIRVPLLFFIIFMEISFAPDKVNKKPVYVLIIFGLIFNFLISFLL